MSSIVYKSGFKSVRLKLDSDRNLDSPVSSDLFATTEVENVLVEMLWKMWRRCV